MELSSRLSFGSHKFSEGSLKRIRTALSKNNTLVNIWMSNSSWEDEAVPALCTFLENNNKIERLWLDTAEIGTKYVTSLCEALAVNSRLQTMLLSCSSWTDDSFDALTQFIKTNHSLQCIALREAQLSPQQLVDVLSAVQRNRSFRALDFNYCTWGEESVAALVRCLQVNHTLVFLLISHSTFTNHGLVRLLGSLCKNTVMKNLTFFGPPLTDAVVGDICSLLEANRNLKRLKIVSPNVTVSGASTLVQSLANNTTLQELDIRGSMTDTAMTHLDRYLEDADSLQKLKATDVTDDNLRWCIRELVKLKDVKEATFDGKTMKLRVQLTGQERGAWIYATSTWFKDMQSPSTSLNTDERLNRETESANDQQQQPEEKDIGDVSEGRPWELAALEPKYRAAYKEACKHGTQTISQSRVMVVGHYRAGKTNLVRCILDQDFEEEHHTTTGIHADPSEAKVDITKTCDWRQLQDESFDSKMAKLLVSEAEEKEWHEDTSTLGLSEAEDHDQPAEDTTLEPLLNTQAPDGGQPTKPEDGFTTTQQEGKPQSVGHGSSKVGEHEVHLEVHAASPVMPEVDEILKATGIPTTIMKEIAEEERKKGEDGETQGKRKSKQLFFWDHAGQGVFYTTHQIFLTVRSIYLIVMTLKEKMNNIIPSYRKNLVGKTVLDKSCPETVQDYLQYWLSCIYTHAKSSGTAARTESAKPQVLIALTHKDECSEDEVQEYKEAIDKFLEEKGYKSLVKEVMAISNRDRDTADVSKLQKNLETLAENKSYTVPLSWYKLREDMMMTGKKSLTLQEVHQITSNINVTNINKLDIRAALSFFHEVGDFVYFDDGPLADVVFLDIQWLVDQFKKVITITEAHKDNVENAKYWTDLDTKGVLHQNLVESVWPEKNTRHQLLNTMLQFSLLMPAPKYYVENSDVAATGKLYLVPSLLSSGIGQVPEMGKVIRLCPNLGFLPIGLFSRLITSLSVDHNWEVCGQIFQHSATFKLNQHPPSKISINKCSSEKPKGVEVIELTVHQGENPSGSNELRDILSTLALSLGHLPGSTEFGVWVSCSTCLQWNFICNLQQYNDSRIYDRDICQRHGPMLKKSEHAAWFCKVSAEERMESPLLEIIPDGKEDRDVSKVIGQKTPNEFNSWEGKLRHQVTRVVELFDLLAFIKVANEDELAQSGYSTDRLISAKQIISEIRTSPLWKVKGFFQAFPLGMQRDMIELLGMDQATFGHTMKSIKGLEVNATLDELKHKQARMSFEEGQTLKDQLEESSLEFQETVDTETEKEEGAILHDSREHQPCAEATQSTQDTLQNASNSQLSQGTTHESIQQDTPHQPKQQHVPSQSTQQDAPHQPTQQDTPHQPTQQDAPHQPTQQDAQHQPTQQHAPHQPTQQDTPHQPTKQDTPHQPTQQDVPYQPTQQHVPHPPTQQAAPHQPTQQNAPHQPTQQDVPHQPTQQDVPHQPTQQDVPHPPTQQDVPHQPTQQDVPHQPTLQDTPHQPTQQAAPHQPTQQDAPHQPTQQQALHQATQQDAPHQPTQQDAPHQPTQQDAPHQPTQQDVPQQHAPQQHAPHQPTQQQALHQATHLDDLQHEMPRQDELTGFTRQFTDTGGVLQNTKSDVVVVVPPGAVPHGQILRVSVNIDINLLDYSQWVDSSKEYIVSPVVECVVDKDMHFQKPVTIAIPMCVTPKNQSDVRVLYSVGDHFEDISNDNGMRYKIKNNTVQIHTRHFTRFIVTVWKTIQIKDVLLTLAASQVNTRACSRVEVRLMAHVNCSNMKDFETFRKRSYPKGMDEINIQLVRLPERTDKLEFPMVHTNFEIEEGFPWKIKNKRSWCTEVNHEINGRDVLLNHENIGSKPIQNYFLQSTDKAEQVAFCVDVEFKYQKETITHTFSIVYPVGAASVNYAVVSPSNFSPKVDANSERLMSMAESIKQEMQNDQLRLVGQTGFWGIAKRACFWANVAALRILHDADKQDVEAAQTPSKRAEALIVHLLLCKPAKLVLFAWTLINEDQEHQLPNSITNQVKMLLKNYNRDEIKKVCADLE